MSDWSAEDGVGQTGTSSSGSSDQARLLAGARSALLGSGGLPKRHQTRVAAWLGRAALEAAVLARLHGLGVDAEQASMRSRLICLRVLDAEIGQSAQLAWLSLSRACHHHAYELSASPVEVGRALDLVGVVTAA